jgi:hypothetical protein
MAYVKNRGPGSARLMTRPFGRNDPKTDLAELRHGASGEFIVPDSIVIISYNPQLTTLPPRQAEGMPAPAPYARLEIEYFCR